MQLAGTFFALAALVSFGFGDFFIQKATRRAGVMNAIFYIAVTGAVLILPFVWRDIVPTLASGDWLLVLVLTVLVTIFAAVFDFAALKQGKISVVEPVLALELPITVGLSMLFLGERYSIPQWLATIAVFVGVMLVMTEVHGGSHGHRRVVEKGVMLAGVGATAMALTNFLIGISSRETSPLLTIWFVHTSIAIAIFAFQAYKGCLRTIVADFRRAKGVIIAQSLLDNLAWIFYSISMISLPIGLATTITESYIALAVLLGIVVNRERLQRHQFQGIAIALAGVALLSYLTA